MLTELPVRCTMLDAYCPDTGSSAVDYGVFSRMALCGGGSAGGAVGGIVSSAVQQPQQQLATSPYHPTTGSSASYTRSPALLPGSGGQTGNGNAPVGGVPSTAVGSISGVGVRSTSLPYGVGFALTAQDIVHQPLQPLTFQGE